MSYTNALALVLVGMGGFAVIVMSACSYYRQRRRRTRARGMTEADRLHALRLAARGIRELDLPPDHRAWLIEKLTE